MPVTFRFHHSALQLFLLLLFFVNTVCLISYLAKLFHKITGKIQLLYDFVVLRYGSQLVSIEFLPLLLFLLVRIQLPLKMKTIANLVNHMIIQLLSHAAASNFLLIFFCLLTHQNIFSWYLLHGHDQCANFFASYAYDSPCNRNITVELNSIECIM